MMTTDLHVSTVVSPQLPGTLMSVKDLEIHVLLFGTSGHHFLLPQSLTGSTSSTLLQSSALTIQVTHDLPLTKAC